MALIICTECGKKFSDRAACCPECGCPTEEVLKDLEKIAEQQRIKKEAQREREEQREQEEKNKRELVKEEIKKLVDLDTALIKADLDEERRNILLDRDPKIDVYEKKITELQNSDPKDLSRIKSYQDRIQHAQEQCSYDYHVIDEVETLRLNALGKKIAYLNKTKLTDKETMDLLLLFEIMSILEKSDTPLTVKGILDRNETFKKSEVSERLWYLVNRKNVTFDVEDDKECFSFLERLSVDLVFDRLSRQYEQYNKDTYNIKDTETYRMFYENVIARSLFVLKQYNRPATMKEIQNGMESFSRDRVSLESRIRTALRILEHDEHLVGLLWGEGPGGPHYYLTNRDNGGGLIYKKMTAKEIEDEELRARVLYALKSKGKPMTIEEIQGIGDSKLLNADIKWRLGDLCSLKMVDYYYKDHKELYYIVE